MKSKDNTKEVYICVSEGVYDYNSIATRKRDSISLIVSRAHERGWYQMDWNLLKKFLNYKCVKVKISVESI